MASSSTPVKTPEVLGPKALDLKRLSEGRVVVIKEKENKETPKPVPASGLGEGAPERFDLATPPGGQLPLFSREQTRGLHEMYQQAP